MRTPDRVGLIAALVGALVTPSAVLADPAPYRYSAPIVVSAAAPFVQVALSPAAYAHALQDDLRDLRIVDARGERAPFALLAPRSALQTTQQLRPASLFALPARPTAPGVWASPVDVVVEGDRISVHRHGPDPAATARPARESGGWLIDTGETRAGDPSPQSLTLRWSGPAEFSAAYRLETSDDLRQWRAAGTGQVMALQSPAGSLTQPVVALPEASGRFVRLVWADAAEAPALTGADVLVAERHLVALDSARELVLAASAEPAGRAAPDAASRRALHFDLGGVLPLIDVDLRFAAGTHVAPVRVQGRSRIDDPWRELGAGVFYRLERGGEVGQAPAIAMPATVRYLRLVPDERGASLDASGASLVVHAALASLVFAAQGEPPFRLLAGSIDAPAGALPLATLVPQLDIERARFGRGELGAFGADASVARTVARSEAEERWRPVLLWGVLLAGVAVLGALVWRLARAGPVGPPPT